MKESAFQRQVLHLAALYRWAAHWNGDSRRTIPGWPDLVLLGHGRALFVELKSPTGRLRPEQRATLDSLYAAGCEVAIWRPADLPDIARVLGPKQQPLPRLS